jgi:glycosyltransferase involved in cell wall biosynthesis
MARCAVYVPSNFQSRKEMFGIDVANLGFFRALAQSPEFSELWFLLHGKVSPDELKARFLQEAEPFGRIHTTGLFNATAIQSAGTLLRGTANLSNLAWLRRERSGDNAYSLVGLIHCIAPPALRQEIADAAVAPTQPWDALICTSPAVRDVVNEMYAQWSDYLAMRFAGNRKLRPVPQLPLIPLGVECDRIAAAAARPEARLRLRAELGLSPDDILVLWVGRLSFFEKAFPQPMFQAVEEAQGRSRARIHFAMTGWFPNDKVHREMYREAAAAHAPSVKVHVLDGTSQQTVEDSWAAADIFLSLVDNIQETFGIAPVEAMAAGLPAVISDWNGYRSTVRHDQDGFLIPTLGAPPGLGRSLVLRHMFRFATYQNYAAEIAQHTAINVAIAAEAIAALANDADLRRRMGESARARARADFDWSVIMRKFAEVVLELERVRRTAAGFETSSRDHRTSPTQADPFSEFAGYATSVLTADTVLRARQGAGAERLKQLSNVKLNQMGDMLHSGTDAEAILSRAAQKGELTVREVLAGVSEDKRRPHLMTIMWLCKIGLLDWRKPERKMSSQP